MKVIYKISRWNNASRARARHIPDADNRPLCGDTKAFSWEYEDGIPTCQKCIKFMKEREREK